MNQKVLTWVGVVIILIIAITAGAFVYFAYKDNSVFNGSPTVIPKVEDSKFCTQEAKLCPDGKTYVGRTGAKCEFAACPAIVGIENKIIISSPETNEIVSSPLQVSGRAVGTWFSEGSFPVEIVDGNGKLLGKSPVNFAPKSDTDTWMTEGFVDFSGTVTFNKPTTNNGFLIFKKDNPSDLPALEEAFRMPVKFSQASSDNGLLWRNYRNEKYGFELSFPETWKGYVVTGRKLDWGSDGTSDSLDFGFPAQKDGLFNVSFHTKKQYDSIVASGAPFGQKLGENKGFVIVWDQAQYAANKEMEKRIKEIKSIIETFQLIVDKG